MENKCSTFKQLSRCPLIAESTRVTYSFVLSKSVCSVFPINEDSQPNMKTGKQQLIY